MENIFTIKQPKVKTKTLAAAADMPIASEALKPKRFFSFDSVNFEEDVLSILRLVDTAIQSNRPIFLYFHFFLFSLDRQ